MKKLKINIEELQNKIKKIRDEGTEIMLNSIPEDLITLWDEYDLSDDFLEQCVNNPEVIDGVVELLENEYPVGYKTDNPKLILHLKDYCTGVYRLYIGENKLYNLYIKYDDFNARTSINWDLVEGKK